MDLQYILNSIKNKEINIEFGGKYAQELLKQANKKNITYFRETLDKLEKEDLMKMYLHFDKFDDFTSISEILVTLLLKGIEDYDIDVINYVCQENIQYQKHKYVMDFYLCPIIHSCIDKLMFDVALIIVKSLDTLNIYFYKESFYYFLKQESISKMDFMLENFVGNDSEMSEKDPLFLMGMIAESLSQNKIISFKFLKGKYDKLREKSTDGITEKLFEKKDDQETADNVLKNFFEIIKKL